MQSSWIGSEAGCYPLYSGLAVLAAVGIMAAPIIHRFLHRFHIEDKTEKYYK